MKSGFAFLLVLASTVTASANVANLNATSTLADQGVEPPEESLRLVTPNILDGVPLMQGLQLVSDKNLVDILPDNSPHPAVAIGILDVDDVYNFYKIAMPDMGWKAAGPRDYMRNNGHGTETLHINAHGDGKKTTVTFTEQTVP